MTNCEKFQEMISCLMDGELSEVEKAEVESHIAVCPECRAMYDDFAALSTDMGSLAEVPAALHNDIMEAVKSAPKAKKKKGLLVSLRPYMGAACLVIIVGLVAMMGTGRGFDSASAAPASAPASAPACEAENYSIPADMPAEYGLEDTVECEEPGAAPEAEEAESGSEDYGYIDKSEYGFYAPGSVIDWAQLSIDGVTNTLFQLDLLSDALGEKLTEGCVVEPVGSPAAELELLSGGERVCLTLYFDGSTIIVEQDSRCYFAAATVQEFLEIK